MARIKQRAFLHFNLVWKKKSARLIVVTNLVKLNLVSNRWRKPCAADDAYFASD